MSEKRFQQLGDTSILDTQTNEKYYAPNETELIDLLNEQEETIEELHISDHMGWKRAEHFEKELKTKKIYIKRLEYKVQKFKEMNKELKFQLDECTNNKLYSRRELEKENEQLKADEKLYAQEILRLKKELKENQALKLGNDY